VQIADLLNRRIPNEGKELNKVHLVVYDRMSGIVFFNFKVRKEFVNVSVHKEWIK